MDEAALERARKRISRAAEGRPEPADLAAALERSREQIEALAATAAELEAGIPVHVGDAVRDGLRAEVLPVGRHIAELRGLFNQAIRRLERIEGDLLAERKARVDDLALLVELVTSGWRGVDARLARLEDAHAALSASPTASSPAISPAVPVGEQDFPAHDSPMQGFPTLGRQADAIAERAVADEQAAAA
ncbi:MAG TPA: hypothetical protein VJK66_03470 [Gaiellaceae bacterium]|nr:hypothetical protein [Gaiellaceae bacterium]